MKIIIINGSPRKNWNTAQLLQEARKGAESVGDSVEYIDLYDLSFTGCRSCMACKRKGIENPCNCYWPDDLGPIVNRIFEADRLIIGSPIYFGEITSQLRALIERICFPALSYNDFSSIFKGKMNVDVFLTMNVGKEAYEKNYAAKFEAQLRSLLCLKGEIRIHPCLDTLQVEDYSKYEMAGLNEEHKKQVHVEQFPQDLAAAFQIGAGYY